MSLAVFLDLLLSLSIINLVFGRCKDQLLNCDRKEGGRGEDWCGKGWQRRFCSYRRLLHERISISAEQPVLVCLSAWLDGHQLLANEHARHLGGLLCCRFRGEIDERNARLGAWLYADSNDGATLLQNGANVMLVCVQMKHHTLTA
jgi:hypothetical protein